MICTSCGQDNGDEARFCARCGRKLQSFFSVPDIGELRDPAADMGRPDDRLRLELGNLCRHTVLRHLEAWLYVGLLLGGVALWGVYGSLWDPWIYLAVLLMAGLVAWRRL